MQHHYRYCGNTGCASVLGAELFADAELIEAEEFACGGCGGGYIAPMNRPGWNNGVSLGYDPFDGQLVENIGGIGFEADGQIDLNVGGFDIPA
jgi:hypothetical protein